MNYRNWKIKAYSSFLGYFVRYTSPIGQTHYSSDWFTTDEQAISYAQRWIDYLLECERCRFEDSGAPPAACAVN
jgi:hypothetical protein